MDAIPGHVNNLILQADQPGQYRGECAEFCGAQHAHMGFVVVAQSQADFDSWLARQKEPAPAPTGDAARGRQVFLQSGCSFCHPLRGLDDSAIDASIIDLGPDLTHLQSRSTIAAATLPNNQGALAAWVVDAQHIKPGVLMPAEPIKPDDLNTLLAYLNTLK
jgi:cytochrome c oxidase subunit 2